MPRAAIILLLAFISAICHARDLAASRSSTQPTAQQVVARLFEDRIAPEKLKEDLDLLFQSIEQIHPDMYAYVDQNQFASRRSELYERIDGRVTRVEFYKLAAPVVADLKSGHTYLVPFLEEYKQYCDAGGRVWPLSVRMDSSRISIDGSPSDTPLPLGATLVSINGRPALDVFNEISRWFQREYGRKRPDRRSPSRLLAPVMLVQFGPVECWSLEVKADDSQVKNYRVSSVPPGALSEGDGNILATKNSLRFLPEHNAALLEINSFYSDPERFQRFLAESFKEIHEQEIQNLIIDVRKNPGGNDPNVKHLIEYLTVEPYRLYEKAEIKLSPQSRMHIEHIRREAPRVFEGKKDGDVVTLELPFQKVFDRQHTFAGKVFVLIGPRSSSGSTVFAAAVKHFHLGLLIGQETGDPLVFFADSRQVRLPNSGLRAMIAAKRMFLPGGVPDGRGAVPDHQVRQKSEDTAKDADTVLEFVLGLIGREKG